MIEEELEAVLASLHEWIAECYPLVAKAINVVREEGISNYPILVVSDEKNINLKTFGVQLPTQNNTWHAVCSTLEQWSTNGAISQERIPDFCKVYKSHGEDAICIMILKAELQHCVFINLKDLEKNTFLEM